MFEGRPLRRLLSRSVLGQGETDPEMKAALESLHNQVREVWIGWGNADDVFDRLGRKDLSDRLSKITGDLSSIDGTIDGVYLSLVGTLPPWLESAKFLSQRRAHR